MLLCYGVNYYYILLSCCADCQCLFRTGPPVWHGPGVQDRSLPSPGNQVAKLQVNCKNSLEFEVGRGGRGVLEYPNSLETLGFPLVLGWETGMSGYFLNTPSLNWSQSPITNNHISQVVPGGLNWANNKQPTLPDLSLCSRRRICRHDP